MDKNFICPKCHKDSYYYNYTYEFVAKDRDLQGIGNLDRDYDKRQIIICPYCYAETPVTEYAEKLGVEL